MGTTQERIELIKRNLNEILGEDTLRELIENNTPLRHYIGFEISGLVHLGTGLSSMLKIKDLQEAGVKCTVYLADWHTWINDKLGGDHEFIKKVAKEYFEPAMRVSAQIVGANADEIDFIHGSELYHNNDSFWQTVIEVSKNLTLSRVLKSTSIMGRDQRESQPFAWLIYPPMQAADIVQMGVNIAHSGTDQRKIHVITREVAQKLKINNIKDINGKVIKPVTIHHDMMLGLTAPSTWPLPEGMEKETAKAEMKMSKSKPDSCVFIHDSEESIKSKINKAFCPEGEVEFNPIMNWCQHLIFPLKGELTIEREERFGGSLHFETFEELASVYKENQLHPQDLKSAVAKALIEILKPARDLFANSQSEELIERIRTI